MPFFTVEEPNLLIKMYTKVACLISGFQQTFFEKVETANGLDFAGLFPQFSSAVVAQKQQEIHINKGVASFQ